MRRANRALLACALPLMAAANPPQIQSVFPIGAARGEAVEVTVLGDHLEGTTKAWFDCTSITGEVRQALPKEVKLRVRVAGEADAGFHTLRLVTPRGVSGAIGFRVGAEPSINGEAGQPGSLPVSINGRLKEPGATGRHSLEGRQGDTWRLEVITGNGLVEADPGPFGSPVLTVYKAEGSWLDPNYHPRLPCENQTRNFEFPRLSLIQHRLPRFVCTLPATGRYLIEVGALDGAGGPHFTYQLRIASGKPDAWIPRIVAHPDPYDLRQTSFARPLEPEWASRLRKRNGQDAGPPATRMAEREPNDSAAVAQVLQLPVLIEGAVAAPADVDMFRIDVTRGQTLVFELETLDTPPPYFNPRLKVVDAGGSTLVENIYRRVDGDGDDWVKLMEPKTAYRFEQGGPHYVSVRDLTHRNGSERFRYRLLVREPVPHVGRVTVRLLGLGFMDRTLDRLNLAPGEAIELPVVAELEEGFDGSVALEMEDLPPGVQAAPAAVKPRKGIYLVEGEVFEGRWEGFINVHRERYRPRRLLINVLLSAANDARPINQPVMARITVTASSNGRLIRGLVTQQIPLMVVEGGMPRSEN
ncbi:MAG: hypothetical protein ACKV22_25785 [Bryobacteraceae bacterium]